MSEEYKDFKCECVRMKGIACQSIEGREARILLAEADLGRMPDKLRKIMDDADRIDRNLIQDVDDYLVVEIE